jgi:hypothetical protein
MDDERYYFQCYMRKDRARIAVTVCHQKRCMFLTSEGGRLRCGYDDPLALRLRRSGKGLPKWPKVSKIERDGIV